MRLGDLLRRIHRNYFYIMHLSYNGQERERLWNYANENNVIGLDAPGIVTNDWNIIRESAKAKLPGIWVRQFDGFCKRMKTGDIVVVLDGWHSVLGVAEMIRDDHQYNKELSANRIFFDHIREVRWIEKFGYGESFTLSRPLWGFNNTLSRVEIGTERWAELTKIPLKTAEHVAKSAKHVAIKCTYNNGGEGVLVGFNGTCSEDIIKWNIEQGRVWCNHKDCECREYYDGGFKGRRPVDPCYESVLFRDWRYGAGRFHTGKRAGRPIHLSNVEKGKIAILTTRFPGDLEENRKIIGLFRIGGIDDAAEEETWLKADPICAIRLPIEEAKELFFWDYYSTKTGAKWKTGLIRYLNDNQVSRILVDLQDTLRDEKLREMVTDILKKSFPEAPPSASGPRIKKSGSRTRRISIIRKYGSVGEGIEHKKLKEWLARNPASIGLSNVEKTDIEYVFPSGDAADIVFRLANNRYAVIEVETSNPLPGCYQALKYRILKCAELGLPISSSHVEAIVVAWSIPNDAKSFCAKYGVRFLRKKLAREH